MITLSQYLKARFSSANALTHEEAKLINIPWPLPRGWVGKYANIEISDCVAEKMRCAADKRKERKDTEKKNRSARAGELERLSRLYAQGGISEHDLIKTMNKVRSGSSIGKTDDGFYASREWRELRYKALVVHGAKCQCCGSTRHDGVRLHVDHIKPRSKFPALQFELSNLQVLCEDCNVGKSNKDQTDWR